MKKRKLFMKIAIGCVCLILLCIFLAYTRSRDTDENQDGYQDLGNVKTNALDTLVVSPYDDYIAYIDFTDNTDCTLHFYNIASGEIAADFPAASGCTKESGCNSGIVFFAKHRCAIAGKKGLQVINTKNMKVLWQGAYGTAVSASTDGSIISVFDPGKRTLTFYTAEGRMLSERTWENAPAIYWGMSGDGRYAAVTEESDEEDGSQNNFYILNTHTGSTLKFFNDERYAGCALNKSSWLGSRLFFTYGDGLYGYVDMDNNQVHKTVSTLKSNICYGDLRRELLYFWDEDQLHCASMETGEVVKTYNASGTIAGAAHIKQKKKTCFAVCNTNGTLEYVDYTKDPSLVESLTGSRQECSDISVGKICIATYSCNNPGFHIYKSFF